MPLLCICRIYAVEQQVRPQSRNLCKYARQKIHLAGRHLLTLKYIITPLILLGLILSNHVILAQSAPAGSKIESPQKVEQPDTQAFAMLYDKAKYPATLKFGDHILKVYGSKDIFISGDDPKADVPTHKIKDIFIGSFSITYDGDSLINDIYCKINGLTEEIHYQSSNSKVISVSNHEATDANSAGRIIIHGVGSAIVTLTLAGQSLELPLKVTKLPVYTCMPTDDLIKLLGLPDKKTLNVVEWPDHKYIDGILYEPSASQEKVYAEHWFYSKYPKVAFAVDGFSFVVEINDMGW